MITKTVPSATDTVRLYRTLRYIRRVEEEIARIYPSDKIKSPVHLSIGQEAIAVGACDPLMSEDFVSASYRGHAAYLAKGGDLKKMMAELYGKKDGCAGGKAGSMHLIDMPNNVLGMSAVVGTTIPVAAGFALSLKRKAEGNVIVAFMGDGATEEGCFGETLNFSSLHKLPILFVCENNDYAIHTPSSKRWATDRLCERVATYGMPAVRIEDGDVLAIREAATRHIDNMRNGGGPAFLECATYRWREHVGPGEDYESGYRDRNELAAWIEKDQVPRLGGMLSTDEREAIDAEIESTITEAIAFAENSHFPDTNQLMAHVYAE
ncbi:MAG: thiamine pyrophosphate-dependent dehydrogenase E1 component subunit alpha [Rhodospirillales bacterium]|nr:thiamine pyrophosphate-dependent dehydrogenase E1 component subunit alpha [Rhodospirillales bacterium]